MEGHYVKLCHQMSTLPVERVAEAREDQIRRSRGMASFYMLGRESRLKSIKQLVQEPPRVGDA